jgi:Ca2+-transporting ATPase
VLLELVIDPTCSIVLERQPAESNIMNRPPRSHTEKLLTRRTLLKSAVQGLSVLAASFGAYLIELARHPENPAVGRSMGLVIIMLANLFLVFVNSSDRDFLFRTAGRLFRDKVVLAANVGILAMIAVILYTPLHTFLKLSPLSGTELLVAAGLAAASVLWYELVKLFLYIREKGKIK